MFFSSKIRFLKISSNFARNDRAIFLSYGAPMETGGKLFVRTFEFLNLHALPKYLDPSGTPNSHTETGENLENLETSPVLLVLDVCLQCA